MKIIDFECKGNLVRFYLGRDSLRSFTEAYLYGEEETHRATPEEVAYFMKRIEMDDTFLSRCDNIESVDFTINWSPEELFNMEVQ